MNDDLEFTIAISITLIIYIICMLVFYDFMKPTIIIQTLPQ